MNSLPGDFINWFQKRRPHKPYIQEYIQINGTYWHLTKMMKTLLVNTIFNTSRFDALEELENQNYLLSANYIFC